MRVPAIAPAATAILICRRMPSRSSLTSSTNSLKN
nr:MAG TPA: hypothetical protein [Caudoviricetes sp.]